MVKNLPDPAESKSGCLKIKIWGARGSIPVPILPQDFEKQLKSIVSDFFSVSTGKNLEKNFDKFLKNRPRYRMGGYGGNTPCVEVTSKSQQIIIDAGSGIRSLGYELMSGPAARGQAEIHILFTHFHWDHVLGLPFFTPIFIPGNKIHFYAVQPDLKDVLKTVFKKPYFPVSLENLGADLIYHTLEPRKQIEIGDLKIVPYQLDHPDPCWGFRIENGEKVYSHCVDTECTRISRDELGLDLPLYQNVDVMVFDSQYTLMESIEKVNWGHAAAFMGLDIAMREGIKKVIFMHYDPAASNDKIAMAENQARRYYEDQLKISIENGQPLSEVDWSFGFEGMTIEI